MAVSNLAVKNKIEVKNLSINYIENKKAFNALNNVSFCVQNGEFVSVIGSSGCGKSTLLSVIEGLCSKSSGSVQIDGKEINGTGKSSGVVFQHYSLFPWMTTKKNIEFGIKQSRPNIHRKQRALIADDFLYKVGLGDFGSKYPSQLSGGMQQRAAIARALAMDTEILLMDEPFSAVDAKNRVLLQDLLLKLWEGDENENRKTVVFVTHDIDEAIFLSDRIIVLSSHPGTVREIVDVPFERSRNRNEITRTETYGKLRNKLVSLLYRDVADQIGGEECVI